MMFDFYYDWKATFPEIYIILILTVLLLYGVLKGNIKNTNDENLNTKSGESVDKSSRSSEGGEILTYMTSDEYNLKNSNTQENKKEPMNVLENISWLSILMFFFVILLILNNPIRTDLAFGGMLLIDDYTNIIKIIISTTTGIVLLLSIQFLKDEKIGAYEYVILIGFVALGLFLLVSSYNFISIYLAIELQSLSLYVLAAFKTNSEYSTEAGLKYFVLGALSSALLLFAGSLIYGFTGTMSFDHLSKLFIIPISELHESASNATIVGMNTLNNGLILSLLFFVVALFFKLSAAPFHMWTPDVYEGSPTSVTAFFAIVPKIAIFSITLRFFFDIFHVFFLSWQTILFFTSILSIFLGTFGAFFQKKIKRLLAYSAISHIGYMLLAFSTGSLEGIQSLFFYILIYIVISLSFFSILLSLRLNNAKLVYLTDFVLLSKHNPTLAIAIAFLFFSMAGIPPLAGFFSKLYVFLAAVQVHLFPLLILVVFASVIGCFYYIRLIKLIYFDQSYLNQSFSILSKESAYILSFGLFILIFFFVYPDPLLLLSKKLAFSCISF